MAKINTTLELKNIRRYGATLERYALHLQACAEYDCPPESFDAFAQDILNAPANARDSLLRIEAPEPYQPIMRYPAYITPVTSEMFTGTPPGSNRPRGKRKPKAKKVRGK